MSSLPSAVLPEIADYLDRLYSLSPGQPETSESQAFHLRDFSRFLHFISSSLSIQQILVSPETDQYIKDILALLFGEKMKQTFPPVAPDLVIFLSDEPQNSEYILSFLTAGKKGTAFVIGHLPDQKEKVQQLADALTASGLKGTFLPVGKGLWFGTKL